MELFRSVNKFFILSFHTVAENYYEYNHLATIIAEIILPKVITALMNSKILLVEPYFKNHHAYSQISLQNWNGKTQVTIKMKRIFK